MTILSVFFEVISPKHTRACSSSKAGKSVWYSSKTSKQVQCSTRHWNGGRAVCRLHGMQSADCTATVQSADCTVQSADCARFPDCMEHIYQDIPAYYYPERFCSVLRISDDLYLLAEPLTVRHDYYCYYFLQEGRTGLGTFFPRETACVFTLVAEHAMLIKAESSRLGNQLFCGCCPFCRRTRAKLMWWRGQDA